MNRSSTFLAFFLAGLLLVVTSGCSGDPNVEGAKLDLRNKDYPRALENVDKALASDPNNAEAHYIRGQVLQEMASTATDPAEHAQLINDMRQAYSRAAEIDAKLATDIQGRLSLAYYNEFRMGVQEFQKGQQDSTAYNRAEAYFASAAEIQPDSAGAYINRAYSLINARRTEEAVAPLEMAIQKGDNSTDAYLLLADLYRMGNRGTDAVRLLEEARNLYPDNADVQAQLLNAYITAGQVDRAMQVYTDAVQSDPSNKLYRYNYGSLLLEAERYPEAIEQLQEAVRLDPQYANAYYNLGAAYINQGVAANEQISKLDDQLREQRDQLSQSQRADLERQMEGLADQRRGYFERAVEPLERARELIQGTGEDPTAICQALFQAYVQTAEQTKAESIAECAGYDLN